MNLHIFTYRRPSFLNKALSFLVIVLCTSLSTQAQTLTTTVDTISIRLGEQVTLGLEVTADTSKIVVFPEAQAFGGLEVIESYKIDTTRSKEATWKLIKKYALTQFDSGTYLLPKQKVIVGDKTLFSDSTTVYVNNVVVDTTKQGLYTIKDPIELPQDYSKYIPYLLWIGITILVIAGFLLWLITRHREKKRKEEIIPPYERAIATLEELDSSDYLTEDKYKDYYTTLTNAVREYYEEKVYNRAMESTTSELIERLELERESGHIDFSKETIRHLEEVLKRADMVKFARIHPEKGKAQADRITVEEVIKQTREVLPQPTEEQLLQDEMYQETLSRKRNRKLYLTAAAGILGILLLAGGVGVAVKGYDEVKDFVFGNYTRELAEKRWITSEYGYPSMVVSTPEVLTRQIIDLPEEMKGKIEVTAFGWESDPRAVTVLLSQTNYPPKTEIDLQQVVDSSLKGMEAKGASFAIVKNEKFTTPNGAEGLKSFGSGSLVDEKGKKQNVEYSILTFQAETTVQQLIMTWIDDDEYADQIARRVLASVELQNAEE